MSNEREDPFLDDGLFEGESVEEREKRHARISETRALIARCKDPDDPYDAHHGTDRSPESLDLAQDHDPETFARVTAKMQEPGGEYRG